MVVRLKKAISVPENAQVFHLPFPEDRGPEGKFSMRATVLI